MAIPELLTQILQTHDGEIKPPNGLPNVPSPHLMPSEMREFYNLCGGVALFKTSEYSIRIVEPTEVMPTNGIVFPDMSPVDMPVPADDISWSWYRIAADDNGNYLSIDLNPDRLGYCYNSFFDRHASPGDCDIVANSLTDLLARLIESRGAYWYWLAAGFDSLGDAYDQK